MDHVEISGAAQHLGHVVRRDAVDDIADASGQLFLNRIAVIYEVEHCDAVVLWGSLWNRRHTWQRAHTVDVRFSDSQAQQI